MGGGGGGGAGVKGGESKCKEHRVREDIHDEGDIEGAARAKG